MYEAIEFVERVPGADATERVLGQAQTVDDAISAAKQAWRQFEASGVNLYAWWLVRESGETLARWIADNHSRKEFVLDITSGELLEVRS